MLQNRFKIDNVLNSMKIAKSIWLAYLCSHNKHWKTERIKVIQPILNLLYSVENVPDNYGEQKDKDEKCKLTNLLLLLFQ